MAVAASPATGVLRVRSGASLESVRQAVHELDAALTLAIPLLVLLTGVVAWRITGRALAPVERIRQEVEAISGSTLHRRVEPPSTGDEVTRLATTMNSMLDRLELASMRQRQFVFDASHEFRSPLATIRAAAEVAAAHPDQTSSAELADTVQREALRLDDLVGDLLELARLDEAAVARFETVDLDDLLVSEAERARSDRLRIDTMGITAARVTGNTGQLRRAVHNLVDNAARHARSSIAVSTEAHDAHAFVHIDDDGSGVPPADRARIFERFTRLDEGRARDTGGVGLGLALGGARFTLRLPV